MRFELFGEDPGIISNRAFAGGFRLGAPEQYLTECPLLRGQEREAHASSFSCIVQILLHLRKEGCKWSGRIV